MQIELVELDDHTWAAFAPWLPIGERGDTWEAAYEKAIAKRPK